MTRMFFVAALWMISQQGFSQMSAVLDAIRSGNASELGSFLEDRVELGIDAGYVFVPKNTAVSQLATFFKNHRPLGFKEIHQGASKGKDAKYTIGELETNNGSFRVYIYANQTGRKTSIQEIRFDRN